MVENCCNIFSAILDGMYGWQDELLMLVSIIILFNFIARWGLRWLHKKFEKQKKLWQASFVKALFAPLIFYTWFFAIVHASNLILPQLVSEEYFSKMHLLLEVSAILSIAWFIMRWKKLVLQLMTAKIKTHEMHIEQGKVDVIDKLITIIVIFLTILMVLEVTNRSVSTLIAFGGVGGLAIAFASQEMIANYFTGMLIYTTRPFSVGDWIQLPDRNIEGYVEEIGWYMTRIRTFEKRPIYVPNSVFGKIAVVTPSRMSHRQFKETINLRYKDLPNLKLILTDIYKMFHVHPDIDQDQKITAHLDTLEKASFTIIISAFTTIVDSEDFADLKQDLLFRVLDIFKNHNAEIASPITEIFAPEGFSLRSESKGVSLSDVKLATPL